MNMIAIEHYRISLFHCIDAIINGRAYTKSHYAILKSRTHLVYWLLGEGWYSWYWHVILVEKYTGGWEDECQVHFMRCSHFEADVCFQLLAIQLYFHRCSRKRLEKTENVLQSVETFFCDGREKRNWISNRFMNIFSTLRCLGIAACFVFLSFFLSHRSPTCFFFLQEKFVMFAAFTLR